jgi:DsbC/DsbD-like thiol-disulfide interchange protein
MTFRTVSFALAALALASTARAQTPVHWTATPMGKTTTPGGKAEVKLSASIDDGWHIYSITQGPGGPTPTKISLPTGQPFELGGDIKSDAPDVKFDQNFGINVETYEKKAEFTIPVAVDKTAKPGAKKIQVAARYQVCNASMCLPPKTEKLSVGVSVKSGKSGKK